MSSHSLRLAARLWGLQTGYTAVGGLSVEAPESTIRKLLEEVSSREAQTENDLRELIDIARAHHDKKSLEPVNVLWCKNSLSTESAEIQATVPNEWLASALEYKIELESGSTIDGSIAAPEVIRAVGEKRSRIRLPMPDGLPIGYHRLSLHRNTETKAYLFVAPLKAYRLRGRKKMWGGFLPLYALRSERNWGIGDLTDMREIQDYLHETGADFFGTLPMLASMSEGADYDPSPYSPASRLFWNEIFLDAGDAKAAKKLRATKMVDYAEVFAAKKAALKLASETFNFDTDEFRLYLSRCPRATAYAKFRSRGEASEERYHLYTQFCMDEALGQINEAARRGRTAGLYLDFPVGVNRGGFDSFQFPESFVLKASAGAPPDGLFPGGQNWGFAPLHPLNLREQGYRYFIESVRQHLRYAKVLRLDHFMGLHRIYVIPEGESPKSGTYVRYFSEEFYSILTIESHRSKVEIVGEDLGTVPESVKNAIERHGFMKMWVLPFEAGDHPKRAIAEAPAKALACVNTHDMVPFAGHLTGRDVALFEKLKVIDSSAARVAKKARTVSIKNWTRDLGPVEKMIGRILKLMAASPSEILLINLEDLWGEREPQNIPGTWREYPNWRRKLKLTLTEIFGNKPIRRMLNDLSTMRKTRKVSKNVAIKPVSKRGSAKNGARSKPASRARTPKPD